MKRDSRTNLLTFPAGLQGVVTEGVVRTSFHRGIPGLVRFPREFYQPVIEEIPGRRGCYKGQLFLSRGISGFRLEVSEGVLLALTEEGFQSSEGATRTDLTPAGLQGVVFQGVLLGRDR